MFLSKNLWHNACSISCFFLLCSVWHSVNLSLLISIYFLSFFRLPKKVEDKLISLQLRFIWGGGPDKNNIAWIKWETACLPKEKGGLGMKDINTFNLALLGKWWWNLFQHEGQLWARVLQSKYGGWRGLDEEPGSNKDSLWWRDLKIIFQASQQGEQLKKGIMWRVGRGDRFKFWEDEWIQGEASSAAS